MKLSPTELAFLAALARKGMWSDRDTRHQLQQAGVNITPANFYSDVPLVEDVRNSFEHAGEQPPYIDTGLFVEARMAAFLEGIERYADDFDPPVDGDPDSPAGFFWGNSQFTHSDAMAYYCALRELRPQRVLEVGSGYSTLVAMQALRDNGFGEVVVIEPFPRPFLRQPGTVVRLIEKPIQSIPVDEAVELVESSQVWFIDSTHTVKVGSDCLYLYLKVMPKVRTEVLCHSHDIFLPFALPQEWALDRHVYWTEQYLLLAYLLGNPRAEILFGSHYLHRCLPERSRAFMRGRYADGGSSLWYRLNGRQAHDA